jgi:class 3 adenylate cyclase
MEKEDANILVIDDDEDVLVAARFLLKRHFTNIFAENGPQKVPQLITRHHVHIALLDMNYTLGETSGKDGLSLLKTIREISPETRVILMTAYGDIDLAIKAIKEGAFDFIIKPWDNTKLVSTIKSALKKTVREEETADENSPEEVAPQKTDTIPFSEVERIFMFLDLKGSTTIAEKLGHVLYFELLNDFFSDIAEPVAKHSGEIYQYVGDEVVVSWTTQKNTPLNACLDCFFSIKDAIARAGDKYLKKYGVYPHFKAGMHVGLVSTGTVGTLKKEIIYTGDVLNTASRIENMCNQQQVELLLSEELAHRLDFSGQYTSVKIGAKVLKGKSAKTGLYTVVRQTGTQ